MLSQRKQQDTEYFSYRQAILYSSHIDHWRRYSLVASRIKELNLKSCLLLDVGGNMGSICEFIDPQQYRILTLDINSDAMCFRNTHIDAIIADGCRIPFKNNSFDIVISVDAVEHIPSLKKDEFCRELMRVAKRRVILHCPLDSSDGKFQGSVYDAKFYKWYKTLFKEDIEATKEHLMLGLPTIEKLSSLFPGSVIYGTQNANIWLKYMKWERIPYVWPVTGLIYKFIWNKKEDNPPFYSCLLIWDKLYFSDNKL